MSLLPGTLSLWRRRSGASAIGIIAPLTLAAACLSVSVINGEQYGFPYDDDARQSSDIPVTSPQYAVVAVGW